MVTSSLERVVQPHQHERHEQRQHRQAGAPARQSASIDGALEPRRPHVQDQRAAPVPSRASEIEKKAKW